MDRLGEKEIAGVKIQAVDLVFLSNAMFVIERTRECMVRVGAGGVPVANG